MNTPSTLMWTTLIIFLLASCSKDKDPEPDPVGTYESYNSTDTLCSNAADNGTTWASSEGFCETDASGQACFREVWTLKSDKTFELVEIRTAISGGIRQSRTERFDGNYTQQARHVEVCFSANECYQATLSSDNNTLTFRSMSDGCTTLLRVRRQT